MQGEVFSVDYHTEIIGDVAVLLRRLANRLFNRREDDFTADAALALNMLDNCQQLTVHRHFNSPFLSKIKTHPPVRSIRTAEKAFVVYQNCPSGVNPGHEKKSSSPLQRKEGFSMRRSRRTQAAAPSSRIVILHLANTPWPRSILASYSPTSRRDSSRENWPRSILTPRWASMAARRSVTLTAP